MPDIFDESTRRGYVTHHLAELLRLLLHIDPNGGALPDGMAETPHRVARMYEEMLSGYRFQDGGEVLIRTFQDSDIEQYDGIVIVKDIPFVSLCEHHMCPFMGVIHIGYIPDGQVVGLSKFSRLVEVYARRFQVQERMTHQIITDIQMFVEPKGVIVVCNAEHTCMTMRGAKAHGSNTTTSLVRGIFETDAAARAEFLSLIR